jgi:hypothetical protein
MAELRRRPRKITSEISQNGQTTPFASCVRRSCFVKRGSRSPRGRRNRSAAPRRATTEEKLMKPIKTSVIALAVSALLAGPVLAQGAQVDTQTRGQARGTTSAPGASGGAETGVDTQVGVPGAKAGVKAKTGTAAGVDAPAGAAKGSAGASGKAGTDSKR